MKSRKKIPVLIDFDGVIKIGGNAAPFTKRFLQFLSEQKISSIIISNSTLKTSSDIKAFLKEKEIYYDIPAVTSVDSTINYIKNNYKKVSVYCSEKIKDEFKNFTNDENPAAVIVGDLGEQWNYETMNEIFRKVFNGADLIAMQKNKFWKPDGKNLYMDAGAFISAIEYAAGKKSILIGKPSPLYFQSAIEMLGLNKNSPFIMIGDDIENDIYAAQKLGGIGILVYTGKTKYPLDAQAKKPNYEANNLEEVTDLLEKIFN